MRAAPSLLFMLCSSMVIIVVVNLPSKTLSTFVGLPLPSQKIDATGLCNFSFHGLQETCRCLFLLDEGDCSIVSAAS